MPLAHLREQDTVSVGGVSSQKSRCLWWFIFRSCPLRVGEDICKQLVLTSVSKALTGTSQPDGRNLRGHCHCLFSTQLKHQPLLKFPSHGPARHDSTCLQFQYLGGWGRKYELKASLGFRLESIFKKKNLKTLEYFWFQYSWSRVSLWTWAHTFS